MFLHFPFIGLVVGDSLYEIQVEIDCLIDWDRLW